MVHTDYQSSRQVSTRKINRTGIAVRNVSLPLFLAASLLWGGSATAANSPEPASRPADQSSSAQAAPAVNPPDRTNMSNVQMRQRVREGVLPGTTVVNGRVVAKAYRTLGEAAADGINPMGALPKPSVTAEPAPQEARSWFWFLEHVRWGWLSLGLLALAMLGAGGYVWWNTARVADDD